MRIAYFVMKNRVACNVFRFRTPTQHETRYMLDNITQYVLRNTEKTMTNPETLKESIITRLQTVIDPETGVDVVRMRLVEKLEVDEDGNISYAFRPSSPVCPIAVTLAMNIKTAIGEVDGVKKQEITIKNYVNAEELNEYLNMMP